MPDAPRLVHFAQQDVPATPNTNTDDIISGDVKRTAWVHCVDPKSSSRFGFWECSAGVTRADYDGITEFCHVLEGEAHVKDLTSGEVFTVKAGDSFVLEAGLKTEWTVPNHIRKSFAITDVK